MGMSRVGCAPLRARSRWLCRRCVVRVSRFRSSLMSFLDVNSEVLERLVDDAQWLDRASLLVARMAPDCTSCDPGMHVFDWFLHGGS